VEEIRIKSKITIKKSGEELNIKIIFFWLYQTLPGFTRLDGREPVRQVDNPTDERDRETLNLEP
jgi:hypothetical protein